MTETRPRPAEPGPATQDTTVRPLRVEVPEEDLVELRRRIAATRWPEQEPVADQSQGMQLATTPGARPLLGHRLRLPRFETRLNAFPQFLTKLDGLDIHFPHNQVDRGGHFAAWEEPQLFSKEVRATFRSLR